MKIKSILFSMLLGATLTFTYCGGKKEDVPNTEQQPVATDEPAEASVPEAAPPQFAVDAAFQQQLSGVFTAYVALKEAFVSSDAARVSVQAAALQKALSAVDMKVLTGAAHNDWMTYLGAMETALKSIVSSSDIEAQRKGFSTVSENLYKSIKAYGLGGATAYYEFCPMAFDNSGGFWLSDAKEIRNPYFGDKMLTCGSVKEVLK